jgi:hypothetical protein
MNKETSSRISHIAGVIMAAKADGNETPDDFARLLQDAKRLAGSCMSQDEHAGQVPKHEPDFRERLKIEREELDERVTKLAKFMTDGAPGTTPLHKEMLGRQLIAMSEYLVVLDERLTDLGIAARSAPVEEIPIGEDDGA